MLLTLLLACSTSDVVEPAAPEPARAVEPAPYWVERTDEELDALLRTTCAEAVAAEKPVLLSFSAPWCGDCKRVRQLETQAPLKGELEHWAKVVADVGRFDRHEPLLQAFGVGGIVTWVALEPDCETPVTGWKRLAEGVFEPATGEQKTAADLAGWLRAARSR